MESTFVWVPGVEGGANVAAAALPAGGATVRVWPTDTGAWFIESGEPVVGLARRLSWRGGGFVVELDARRRLSEERVTVFFAGRRIEERRGSNPSVRFFNLVERIGGITERLLRPSVGAPVETRTLVGEAWADVAPTEAPWSFVAVATSEFTGEVREGWRCEQRAQTAYTSACWMAEWDGPLELGAVATIAQRHDTNVAGVELRGDGPGFRWIWCDGDRRATMRDGVGAEELVALWEDFGVVMGEPASALGFPRPADTPLRR